MKQRQQVTPHRLGHGKLTGDHKRSPARAPALAFFAGANGNVGLGTITPGAKLEVTRGS